MTKPFLLILLILSICGSCAFLWLWKVSQLWVKVRVAKAKECVLACICPGMDVALASRERMNRQGGMMKQIKNTVITVTAILLFGAIFFSVAPAQGEVQPSDPAAYYKSKCVACHGPKAEKKFDATLTDEQHLDAILKGKKPEKPPNMPAYGEKGVTPDHAKALLEHMKQLRSTQ
jgi:mono/diheme cytochrome c family protein